MKKITQNFTNVKVWQSIMVAFIFLLSITTFSQTCPTDKFNQDPVVGDQLGENVTIQATSMSKSVNATIPWSEGLESGTQGDLLTAQTGSATNYNWVIATGHFTHNIGDDGLQGDGGDNYLRHDDVQPDPSTGSFENWVITPTFDLSAATSPELNYWEHVHWMSYADEHLVMYSTDYVDNGSTSDTSDVTAATWVTLNDVIFDNVNYDQYYSGCGCDPTNAWGESTFALPTDAAVTVAFKYVGGFDSDWLIDDISVIDTAATSADWSVSVAGSNATLSISDLANFNVGNGSGYDGHWHYTLDGGSTNMVYDTNDVELTDLSVGQHTIVAWLVDQNHAALDPAVEETITFTIVAGVSSYPFCSSFDTDLDGWDTSIYSGNTDWLGGATANTSGSVTPLSGAGMALFYSGNYNGDIASITSPSMNLNGLTDVTVTFNYTQQSWAGDQDELRVFYRDGVNGTWVELAAYTTEVTAWTEVTLSLPNTSDDYYIGFQGYSGYGYGITVDDVCVDGTAAATSFPWSDDFESGGLTAGGWTNTEAPTAGSPASLWDVTDTYNNTDGGSFSAFHTYSQAGTWYSFLVTPTFDLSGASDPVLSYSELVNWSTWADNQIVAYSEDYTDDVETATWVTLNDVIGAEDTWVDMGPYALPTSAAVTVAFIYTGYDASEWFIDDVSIEENTMSIDDEDILDMRIYPNPVDGNYVTILSPINGTKYIEVFDINGRRVMDTTINNDTLDVSSINSGFYMIKVTIDGQSKISKLVVR